MTADQQRIDILLARRMAGEATPAEQEELQQLLKDHPGTAFMMEVLNATQSVTPGRDPEPADPQAWAEKSWLSLEAAMNTPEERETPPVQGAVNPAAIDPATHPVSGQASIRPVRRIKPWLYAAAAVLAVAVAVPFLFKGGAATSEEKQQNRIVMKRGDRSSISLPDGSKVWVNSGSRLAYGNDFGKGRREVFLEGEACFDVAPDEKHPFVVRTGNMDIRVLGTRFNIKAYPEDGEAKAILLSGKVQLTLRNVAGDREKDLLLEPGQKVTLGTAAGEGILDAQLQLPLQLATINPANCDEIAWIDNRLVFRDVPFRSLARDMERWYNVNIHFEDAALEKELFNGVFDKQQITEALKALQIATPFTYTRKGPDIYIRKAVQ